MSLRWVGNVHSRGARRSRLLRKHPIGSGFACGALVNKMDKAVELICIAADLASLNCFSRWHFTCLAPGLFLARALTPCCLLSVDCQWMSVATSTIDRAPSFPDKSHSQETKEWGQLLLLLGSQ